MVNEERITQEPRPNHPARRKRLQFWIHRINRKFTQIELTLNDLDQSNRRLKQHLQKEV